MEIRTAANEVLRDKVFNIAKDPKYDGYQRGLAFMVYKFFDKKIARSGVKSMPHNEQLAEELHKPIIKDNIWGADLADIQLIKDLDFYYVLFLANMLGLFL